MASTDIKSAINRVAAKCTTLFNVIKNAKIHDGSSTLAPLAGADGSTPGKTVASVQIISAKADFNFDNVNVGTTNAGNFLMVSSAGRIIYNVDTTTIPPHSELAVKPDGSIGFKNWKLITLPYNFSLLPIGTKLRIDGLERSDGNGLITFYTPDNDFMVGGAPDSVLIRNWLLTKPGSTDTTYGNLSSVQSSQISGENDVTFSGWENNPNVNKANIKIWAWDFIN